MSTLKLKLPHPHPAQQEILKSKAKRVTIMAGRQFGKSSLCLQICLQEVLKGRYTTGAKSKGKFPSVLYITPFYDLAKNFFKEFLTYIPEDLIQEKNQTSLYVKLVTGGEITFKSAESSGTNGAGFRGYRRSLIICDEFAYYKNLKKFWEEDVEPSMLGYDGGRAYFISTPVGHNTFYDYFLKGRKGLDGKPADPDYESFHYTGYDNPYIDHTFIDKKKEELPSIVFEQEYLAQPSANKANPFGLNITKNIIPSLSKGRAECFGIDLAKHVDFTVVSGLNTNKKDKVAELCYLDSWQGADWNITKAKILQLPRSTEKMIDSTGIGDVILDDLRLSMPNIKGFKFNKKTKGELVREFIKAVETSKIRYTQEVADQMMVFEYKYNAVSGHISYNAQDGYHDDILISVMICWWLYNRKTRRSNSWCIGTA